MQATDARLAAAENTSTTGQRAGQFPLIYSFRGPFLRFGLLSFRIPGLLGVPLLEMRLHE